MSHHIFALEPSIFCQNNSHKVSNNGFAVKSLWYYDEVSSHRCKTMGPITTTFLENTGSSPTILLRAVALWQGQKTRSSPLVPRSVGIPGEDVRRHKSASIIVYGLPVKTIVNSSLYGGTTVRYSVIDER